MTPYHRSIGGPALPTKPTPIPPPFEPHRDGKAVAHVCGIGRRDGPGGDMLQAEFINGEAGTTQPDGAPPTVIAVMRGQRPQLRGNLGKISQSASSQEGGSDRSRIKDGDPSHTDPLNPGSQPQGMDRADR